MSHFPHQNYTGDKGSSESSSISGRQHEEVCQRHFSHVRPDTPTEATVCESGGRYTKAQPDLHLSQRGQGHVSVSSSVFKVKIMFLRLKRI